MDGSYDMLRRTNAYKTDIKIAVSKALQEINSAVALIALRTAQSRHTHSTTWK